LKRLIVNADDFGFARDVNEGIIQAHRHGIVTATTLMAVGSEFHHAVILAKDHAATLDVGIHLTLIGTRALSRLGKALPESPQALVWAVTFRTLNIARELDLQVTRVLETGLQPTHLDTHKHSHLLPQVAEVVGELSERYRIPWVRRPLPKPILGAMSLARLRRVLAFLLPGQALLPSKQCSIFHRPRLKLRAARSATLESSRLFHRTRR